MHFSPPPAKCAKLPNSGSCLDYNKANYALHCLDAVTLVWIRLTVRRVVVLIAVAVLAEKDYGLYEQRSHVAVPPMDPIRLCECPACAYSDDCFLDRKAVLLTFEKHTLVSQQCPGSADVTEATLRPLLCLSGILMYRRRRQTLSTTWIALCWRPLVLNFRASGAPYLAANC